MASIFSGLDPKLREAILQELLAQEEGSIRARDPNLTERVQATGESADERAVSKMRGLPVEEPGVMEMLQQIGMASAEVARGLVPFYSAFQSRGAGGGVPVPGTQREVRPAPAILDAIDTVMPGAGEAGFLIPAIARRIKRVTPELTPAGTALEAELRAKAEQELTTPGQMADAIEDARHARESATGAQTGRVGIQNERDLHAGLRTLNLQAIQEGVRGAVEDRITEDVMLDNIVEMLRSGEIPAVAPVKQGDVVKLLPRERSLISNIHLRDSVEHRAQVLDEARAEAAADVEISTSVPGADDIRGTTEFQGNRVVEYIEGSIDVFLAGRQPARFDPNDVEEFLASVERAERRGTTLSPQRQAIADAIRRHRSASIHGGPRAAATAESLANQRSLDAYVDDQLAMLDRGDITLDEMLRGMEGEDANHFLESMQRRGIHREALERELLTRPFIDLEHSLRGVESAAAAGRAALTEPQPQAPDRIYRILGSLDHPATFRELSSVTSAEDAAAIVDAAYGYGNFDELGNLIEILPEESSGHNHLLRAWMDYRANILEGRASQPRRPARQGPSREEPE